MTVPAEVLIGEDPAHDEPPRRVVYLLGAGATQGAVQFAGSTERLVMPGLIETLLEQTRLVYIEHFGDHPGLKHLVNDVVEDNTDFEHLLTFLEDTPSARYQDFAQRLKRVFATVLRAALDKVQQELGDRHSELYAVLLDMHAVSGANEELAGFLTLNYDAYLEHAIEKTLGRAINYGVKIADIGDQAAADPIPVLKLHGSFSWRHTWPIEVVEEMDAGLWIPPGIRKAKGEYPFNAIWGAARELLDCDVLRIIGCNLGPNDWDLVSLLFTSMHGRDSGRPYVIEVVSWPGDAARIASAFPYLDVQSLLEIPEVGAQLIAEVLGRDPIGFSDLNALEQAKAVASANEKVANPFEHWLRLKGELMLRDVQTLKTDHGLFSKFVEASA